ncbi:unnamed protein product [Polarella glacialis]|uniref:Uncharacterized protein n=1 Tax=Polarella glacialis TaxID=89957 RepID=A0A813GDL0_POLGL|nr:unnamed protein product [Polarella glacialis]|mmetsp:Transcript_47330/g.85282  ORF Transcript_47330/g.85282 Transcript_47330/m.85282 type:complete len:425 (+) Transcript_47330:76-1350(+)
MREGSPGTDVEPGPSVATPVRPATKAPPEFSPGLTYSEGSPSPIQGSDSFQQHLPGEVSSSSLSRDLDASSLSAFNARSSPSPGLLSDASASSDWGALRALGKASHGSASSSTPAGGGHLPSTRNALAHSSEVLELQNSQQRGPSSSGLPSSGGLLSANVWAPPPEAGLDDFEDDGGFFFEVQGEHALQPEDAREIHGKLQNYAETPLELAVLARLRAWETSGDAYTLEEMMGIVRWLEPKIVPPVQLPFWQRVQAASIPAKLTMTFMSLLLLGVLMLLVAAATGLLLEACKVSSVRQSGWLTFPDPFGNASAAQAIGVGQAVNLHGLLDYPSLKAEDLRRAQDVVFTHEGSFHFYRIANIAQTVGDGVKITAEDGTNLYIQSGVVSFERPWTTSATLSQSADGTQGASMATAGTFKAIMPYRH